PRPGSVLRRDPAVLDPAARRSTRPPRGGPMAALDTGETAPTATDLSDMHGGVFTTTLVSADVVATADAHLSCSPVPVGNPQRNALVLLPAAAPVPSATTSKSGDPGHGCAHRAGADHRAGRFTPPPRPRWHLVSVAPHSDRRAGSNADRVRCRTPADARSVGPHRPTR